MRYSKCDIFHSRFHCVQLEVTRPFKKHLSSGIFKDPLDPKYKIFLKTEFVNFMFHVKNWNASLKIEILNWNGSCKNVKLNWNVS